MGYKLAGYEHLGGVELDPSVCETYRQNLHPRYLYCEDIRDFNKREDLPAELYQLDLLDGSPPCSTFSTAGKREKAWGKEKVFSEGQKLQRLDDLVFVYCDTIAKLKPKVCLLENVSGLVKGNGKTYAKEIARRITEAGYRVQVFLLNAATMGVPQSRERVFFIGLRNDFSLPKLELSFNERPVPFGDVYDEYGEHTPISDYKRSIWKERKQGDKNLGDIIERIYHKDSCFNNVLVYKDKVLGTLEPSIQSHDVFFWKPERVNNKEVALCSSFPLDYTVPAKKLAWYCGMSVPPVMTAQISNQIYKQWLSKICTSE